MSMTWDFILRLFVAGALGTVIGLDREYRAKEAGYRTHFLVSLGSALIMIVSQYGFMEVVKMEGIDPVSYTHLDVYKRQAVLFLFPVSLYEL